MYVMDENEKMQIIKTIIVPHNNYVLKDMQTLFDSQVIRDVEEVKCRHNNIPLEEVLRPFTI